MQTESKINPNTFSSILKDSWFFILVWMVIIYRITRNLFSYFFSADIYHMLSAGKAISILGVLKDDVFFVESGHKIVIQQWLYDLFVFKVYDSFGKPGILFLTLCFAVLFIILAVRLLRIWDVDFRIALTAVLLICLYDRVVISIRPGLLTMIILIIQVILCELYCRSGKIAYLFIMPLLTLVEINMHSALWIAHFIFLLPYIVPVPSIYNKYIHLEDHHISVFKLAGPIIGMIASLFINPYGINGITILFDQSEIADLGIMEMKSPVFTSKYSLFLIVMLIIFVFAYGKIKIHSSNAFMFLGTAIMMMIYIRNIQMFSIGVIVILGDLLLVIPVDKITDKLKNTKKLIVTLSSVLVITCIVATAVQFPFSALIQDNPADNIFTPVAAVEYLNENASSDSRIYTDFNNGSYVSWSGYKIYFSSRTEGYCQNINGGYDLVGEYLTVFNNTDVNSVESFEAFLDKYSFEYLIVDSKNRMLPYLMMNEDYDDVLYGNGYVVFRAI